MNKSSKFSLKKTALVILLLRMITYLFLQLREVNESLSSDKEAPTIEANLLGLDHPQQIYIEDQEDKFVILVKDNNETVASKEFEKSEVREPIELSVVKLKAKENKEYLHWAQSSGPHQFEYHFFTVYDNEVMMIPGADMEKEVWYVPFWTSRGTKMLIKDIDLNGSMEIVEFVDEYPPDAPRLKDLEIKKITEESFNEQGLASEEAENAWIIVSRENSGIGRGFRVVWNIYSFTEGKIPYFEKLNDQEYEYFVGKLLADSPAYLGTSTFSTDPSEGLFTPDPEKDLSDTISRTQLSQDSIEFNEFVRQFWARGYYSEPFSTQE